MEQKTKVSAEDGQHDLLVSRKFDLPLELLFKAHVEPQIVEQWMGTRVLKLEARKHGGWQFETTDPKGNKHGFNGVFHDFVPNEKITRTFEMESGSFGVQLEFLEFRKLTNETSMLTMHIIHRSVAQRDQMLKLPFVQGIHLAHNRLQDIVNRFK